MLCVLWGELAVGGEAPEDGPELGGLGELGGERFESRRGRAETMVHGLTHLLEALGPWLVFGLVFL